MGRLAYTTAASMSRAGNRRTYDDDIHQTDDYGEEEVSRSSGRKRAAGGNGGSARRAPTSATSSSSDVPVVSRPARGGRRGGRGGARSAATRPHAPDFATPSTSASAEIREKRIQAPSKITGLILSGLTEKGLEGIARYSNEDKEFIVSGSGPEVNKVLRFIKRLRGQFENDNGKPNGAESKRAPKAESPKKGFKKGKAEEKKAATTSTPTLAKKSPKKETKSPKKEVVDDDNEVVGAGVTVVSEHVEKKLEVTSELVEVIAKSTRQIVARSRAKVTQDDHFFTLTGTRTQVEKGEKQLRKIADSAAKRQERKVEASTSPAAAKKAPKPKKEGYNKKEGKENKAAPKGKTEGKSPAKKAEKKEGKKEAKAEKPKKEKKPKSESKGEGKKEDTTPRVKESSVSVPLDIFSDVCGGDHFPELQRISDDLHVVMNVTLPDEKSRSIVLRGAPSDVNKAKTQLIRRIKNVKFEGRKRAREAAKAASGSNATTDATPTTAAPAPASA